TFISVGSEEPSGSSVEYEWVELCNKGSTAINVSGWYITDNDGNKFYITGAGEIPAGGYLVAHLAESGTNSSTNVYGPIISEDTVTSLTWELGPATCNDTGIWINEPNRNIGYDGWMELMDWDSATAVDNGLFQFDLSIFSANDIIDANYWMYRYDGSTSYDGNFSACRVTQSWTETGATWNTYDGTNNWYMAGGDFNPDIYDYVRVYQDNNGWYKWNITGLMDGWKDGTYPNYGMILVGNDEADWAQLRPSDYDVTAYRPRLIINYTVPTPTQYFMLENTDDLTLYDDDGNMIDYLVWGADIGVDDDSAAAWRQWTAGDYIDSSSLLENQTLGRDQNENDTDEPEDWQNASDKADPFGIDRSIENGSSPNACNVDFIIPEFEEIVIPFAFMILIVAVWRRKRYKKKEPKEPPIPQNQD
ncbi:MAG: DNRLRE domain-containing protein, partial [Methanomassiliicoccales archaeon]